MEYGYKEHRSIGTDKIKKSSKKREYNEKICANDTGNDFIMLEVLRPEKISMDKKYPGIKTRFMGHIQWDFTGKHIS